eukprot:221824-Chlamydomonas_euryale.AAC.2
MTRARTRPRNACSGCSRGEGRARRCGGARSRPLPCEPTAGRAPRLRAVARHVGQAARAAAALRPGGVRG